jgi:hypothetical protein
VRFFLENESVLPVDGGRKLGANANHSLLPLYCAVTVSMTADDPSLPLLSDDATAGALRKKTAAELGSCDSLPDAIVASVVSTLAKPDPASRDHCCFDLPDAEPIESAHACVALTVMTRPSVAG